MYTINGIKCKIPSPSYKPHQNHLSANSQTWKNEIFLNSNDKKSFSAYVTKVLQSMDKKVSYEFSLKRPSIYRMANDNKGWDPSQLRKCDLEFEEIPRFVYNDPRVDEFISENKPVVILGSKLAKAAEKWTLDYLEKNMGNGDFTVFLSKNHKFKYYDDKKSMLKSNSDFIPPTKKLDMKLPEFIKRLREWKKGDDRLYLQQGLNNTVGPAIVHDFLNFDWNFCTSKQSKHNWGPLTSNLLLIGMEGNVTPCHYDEQQNLFAQVHGYKRCILFPPDQFDCLYPHPVHHPHDRQSMVDFDKPDYSRFPKFREARGCETVIGPGEVLYIPMYWWHHIESLMRGSYTVTVNFWYKGGPNGTVTYPLKGHQKVAVMRNVEKMLLDVLQDPKEIPPLFTSDGFRSLYRMMTTITH